MLKNIFKFKKAFTLIEIMIVIVIVWILMTATMRFWWDRIGFLNNKNVKEQFISNYDSIYSDTLMSNYYLWDIFKTLQIKFSVWTTWFGADYHRYNDDVIIRNTYVDGWKYKITKLSLDGNSMDDVILSFSPYILWCKIDWLDDKVLEIDLFVNDSKNYCFEINSDNCRISTIMCK